MTSMLLTDQESALLFADILHSQVPNKPTTFVGTAIVVLFLLASIGVISTILKPLVTLKEI